MAVREEEPTKVGGAEPPTGTGSRRYRPAIPLGLTLAAYALAFAQRPGLDSSDTKINLHVAPAQFLSAVAQVWSPTASLGHVQGGQYSGYLWPMGPFFALGHLLGLPDWVTERLWLGTLLALASYGAVRLVDTWLDRRRGVAHVIAGALYMVNPYVVVFTTRTTVFLLAYAALPWLLLITHRGLRDPRRWWWPAAFALVTTSTAGGVNATVTAFVLLGPVLLGLFELATRGVPPPAAWSFAWRTTVATIAASLWWVIPLLVQSRYGLNFLQFTEQVGAIWATTSLTESLRLMGYWPSYLGVGYADRLIPYFADSGTLLFDPAVVVATLLVPAFALTGYLWTRRWRYAGFLLGAALIALLTMSVGYPDGTPGRKAATFLYNHLTALQFLRTTYKAGPLLAVAVALLAAAGARALWHRTGPWTRAGGGALALALLVLSALPFFEGRALELTWRHIPAPWRQAARGLDSQLPANSRALVLPGQAFAFYHWGGTVDPLLPALTRRPVAVRNTPPYDDLHAVDYLWTVDDLVQQQRLIPGELPPLLDLMSARAVITATDDNHAVSGAMPAAAAAATLAAQPGFDRPSRTYGPTNLFASPPTTADPPAKLPEVRRYDTPARGLVRIEPVTRPTLLDGSATGIADAAALGTLPRSTALLYAGDLRSATIRKDATAGANVLITDSNRRRVFVASRVRQNVGWTVAADEPFSADAAVLDPFASAGTAGQTVAVFEGVRSITAPYNPELAEFPEHRPFAAFDHDPSTSWQADPTLDVARRWIEVGFQRRRDVPYVDILPDRSDPVARVSKLEVGGTTFTIHPGWNRLRLGLRQVSSLRFLIVDLNTPHTNTGYAGGLAEVRIPGVSVRELLRPPVLAETALRGANLSHSSLSYVFERTTADQPLERGPAPAQVRTHGDRLEAEAALVRQAQDPETGIARTIYPPVPRAWTVSGLATVSPTAPDSVLDHLASTGTSARVGTGSPSFTSSGRLENRPAYRASSAFDTSSDTAWVAPYAADQPAWLSWRIPAPRTIRRLKLIRSGLEAQFPTLVSVSADGAPPLTAPTDSSGAVTLPRPLHGRRFVLRVLRAGGSSRAAVAVAEISGSGIPSVRPARAGDQITGRCGDLTARIGGQLVALRVHGARTAFDQGEPLRFTACTPAVRLGATPADVIITPTTFRPLLAELSSPAPASLATAAAASGAILHPGHQTPGAYTDVSAAVRAPSWLVLGESYNPGWQARCDGRSLGAPHVIDGFANGWPLNHSCPSLAISFAPQTTVDAGYLAGAVACAILLLVLILRRPTGLRRSDDRPPALTDDGRTAWSPRAAAGAGIVAAAVFGFLFGLRAGVVVGPAFALILWRGIGTRTVLKGAGALLIVVIPLLYLSFPGQNQGGWDVDYAPEHLGAHWVAVAAFALLALALARDLSTAMGLRRGGRARPPDV